MPSRRATFRQAEAGLTRALRSPGSALKPFIYAFAFDDGVAAPDTVIQDPPRRFADYQPENFDRVFHDKVSARDALAQSLNMPAVATLAKVGPDAFEARLAGAGVTLDRPQAQTRNAGLLSIPEVKQPDQRRRSHQCR